LIFTCLFFHFQRKPNFQVMLLQSESVLD
jgi:hypothetical protein